MWVPAETSWLHRLQLLFGMDRSCMPDSDGANSTRSSRWLLFRRGSDYPGC